MLATRQGMAIRFDESQARAMGRNTRGVKGISLTEGDEVVGMVVADPEGALLTVCEKGYGKRTPFGPNTAGEEAPEAETEEEVPEAPAEEMEEGGRAHRLGQSCAIASSSAAARACAISGPRSATAWWSVSPQCATTATSC